MKSCEFQESQMAGVEEEVETGYWPSLGHTVELQPLPGMH